MASKVRITLRRSTIGQKPNIAKTVKSLGLRRISSSVVHENNEAIKGMVRTVSHLVSVEEEK